MILIRSNLSLPLFLAFQNQWFVDVHCTRFQQFINNSLMHCGMNASVIVSNKSVTAFCCAESVKLSSLNFLYKCVHVLDVLQCRLNNVYGFVK